MPEFTAAVIWIMLKGVPSTLISRSVVDTMPSLMEKVSSPRGLPMTAMSSPTCRASELPMTTGVSSLSALIFKTAMSKSSSPPMTSAS